MNKGIEKNLGVGGIPESSNLPSWRNSKKLKSPKFSTIFC